MQENIELLEQLLVERKIKEHFNYSDDRVVRIKLKDLYQLCIEILKLSKSI
nr:hypothetical protein [Clostridia bacterium]